MAGYFSSLLGLHPVIHVPSAEDSSLMEAAPFPWIGDFLLFLLDEQGPYCINLTVKATEADFHVPSVGVKLNTDMKRAAMQEEIRHRVEKILYDDVGIPTIRVAGDQLNTTLRANLEQIHGWQRRAHPFDESQHEEILARLREGMWSGLSGLEVIHHLIVEHNYSLYDLKIVMYQAIWKRQLRIDLYQYFFIERPLIPERKDVLDEFKHWFKRD